MPNETPQEIPRKPNGTAGPWDDGPPVIKTAPEAPPVAATPTEYKLSTAERGALAGLHQLLVSFKLQVYHAQIRNEETEAAVRQAQDALKNVETQWQASLGLLAVAHGMTRAQISEDMTTLVSQDK